MHSDWSKPMFYQSMKHRKSVYFAFIVFFATSPLYYKANKEVYTMYYTDKTLQTFKNTREM